jgi:hypothetical protein
LALALHPAGHHRFDAGEEITLRAHPQLGFFNKDRRKRRAR